MRLAIFGTGGMGREAMDIARRVNSLTMQSNEIVFVTDDNPPIEGDLIVLAVGEGRRDLAERYPGFTSLIAISAIVSPSAEIGEGALVCEQAFISDSVKIGRHFQANVFAQVSHDAVIGDFVTLSPRATVNGWVEIGDDVFVGAGAVIRNGSPDRRLKIGAGATIGMGAVVTKDVPEGATVVGVPAIQRS